MTDRHGTRRNGANGSTTRFSVNGRHGGAGCDAATLVLDLERRPSPLPYLDALRRAGATVHVTSSVADAVGLLAAHKVIAGLLHLGAADDERTLLPEIEALVAQAPAPRLIALVAREVDRSPLLVRLVQRGLLYDYHTLPVDTERLLITLGRIRGLLRLEGQPGPRSEPRVPAGCRLIGAAPAMLAVREAIAKVGLDDAPVLITGESGTGKELAAREIHDRSPFRDGPFVAVNCAALPPHLIASELFGHEKGAFTGAHQRKIGQIEAAEGGTLFLDEIGDLPLDVQGHLLRFLQDKTIQRVGSTRPIAVNLRIVSATHVDCARAVREGRFREDLYYRLNVLGVHMPALRERAEDVPALAEFYLQKFTEEHGRPVRRFHPATEAVMRAYDWPGNVRELVSAVRRAVVMADGRWLTAADLGLPSATTAPLVSLNKARREVEAALIRRALDLHGYNIQSAARALGVSRVTLYRLMEKHAVDAVNGHAAAWDRASEGLDPSAARPEQLQRRRAGAQIRQLRRTA